MPERSSSAYRRTGDAWVGVQAAAADPGYACEQSSRPEATPAGYAASPSHPWPTRTRSAGPLTTSSRYPPAGRLETPVTSGQPTTGATRPEATDRPAAWLSGPARGQRAGPPVVQVVQVAGSGSGR
jgi:hypothetical protein